MPCVSASNRYYGLDIDCVGLDVGGAIDEVIGRLHDAGHRRIGFLHGTSLGTWVEDRFAAYVTALARRDIRVDSDIILNVYGHREPVARRATHLLELTRGGRGTGGGRGGVTAWVCSHDQVAYELCRLFQSSGLRVPDDVSVTGFDGVVPPADLPKLTTVESPLVELGAAAFKRLLFRIKDPASTMRSVQLACRVAEGATLGPARAHGL